MRDTRTFAFPKEYVNPDYFPLPHPRRLDIVEYATRLMPECTLAELVGPSWGKLKEMLLSGEWCIPDAVEHMAREDKSFSRFAMATSEAPAGYNFGTLDIMLMSWRISASPLPMYQTTDALEQHLLHTDIGPDTPAYWFKAPAHLSYFEFGRSRSSPLIVHNIASGEHVLEGAYLTETKLPDGRRSIHIMCIGSPVGKSSILDDASISFRFQIDDEVQPLSEVLAINFKRQEAQIRAMGMVVPPEEDKHSAILAIQHLAKVLLYLNSDAPITTVNNELDALAPSLARVQHGKRAKLLRKANKLYNRVVVGPATILVGSGAVRHPTAHWRRGHFRQHAHGPGYSLRKLLWIQPVLVGFGGAANGPC